MISDHRPDRPADQEEVPYRGHFLIDGGPPFLTGSHASHGIYEEIFISRALRIRG